MTTTPHPKARRGGRTFVRWMVISRRGYIHDMAYRTRHDAEWDAFEEHGDSIIRVTITEAELRRGKGGGKA